VIGWNDTDFPENGKPCTYLVMKYLVKKKHAMPMGIIIVDCVQKIICQVKGAKVLSELMSVCRIPGGGLTFLLTEG